MAKVGDAYVKVHADGRGLEREIAAMFKASGKRAGAEAGKSFMDEWGEQLRKSLAKSDRSFTASAMRWRNSLRKVGDDFDDLGDKVGRAFGRGARNNFVNLIGSMIGNIARLPGLLSRVGAGFLTFGINAVKSFNDAGGSIRGLVPVLGSMATKLGVAGFAIISLTAIVGALTTALELAGGGVIALAGSLSFALVGAIGAAAGALVPLVAGIATAVIGIANMDKEAKQAFKGVKDAFGDLGKATSGAMFENVGASADKLEGVIRGLTPLMRALGGAVRNVFDGWVEGMNTPEFNQFRDFLAATLPNMVESLGRIAGNLGQTFANIWIVATPYVQDFLGWLEGVTEAWARFSGTAGGQNKIADFFDHSADSLRRVAGFLDSVIELVGELFSAGRQTGDNLFASMEKSVRGWTAALRENPDILQQFFEDAERFAKALGNVVVQAGRLVGALDSEATRNLAVLLGTTLANSLETVATLLGPVIRLLDAMDDNVATLITTMAGLTFLGFGSKLSSAVTSIQGFNTALRTSDSKMRAFGGSMKTLGGVAGFAGLSLALNDASQKGNKFGNIIGGIAGGAGIGMMFGPMGALIGAGVGGGLTALAGAFSDAGDAAKKSRLEMMKATGMKEAKEDADQLAEALSGVVTAYGKVGRAAVEASFVNEDGQLDSDVQLLRDLGVSMDTITSAALGQAGAQKTVTDTLSKYRKENEDTLATERRRYEYMKSHPAAPDVGGPRTGTRGEGPGGFTPEEIAKQKALMEGAAKATDDAAAAEANYGARVKENTATIEAHREEMQALAKDLGVSVKAYKEFPRNVRTNFEERGLPETVEGVERLLGEYKSLRNFKSIKALISAPGVDATKKQVVDLGKQYKLTPKQIKTLVEAETGQANKDIDKTQKNAEDLHKQHTEPKINADNSSANKSIEDTAQKLRQMDTTTATSKLNVDNSGAQGAISQTEQWLNSIQDELVYVRVERTYGGGAGPQKAAGGLFSGAQAVTVGEAGTEAIVPLHRPLGQVDPAVRWLSAIAQGLQGPMSSGPQTVIAEGAINVYSPNADPYVVAVETVNRIAARMY